MQIGVRFESQEKHSTATYSDLTCIDEYCRVFNAALDYAEGKNLIKNGIPFIYNKKRIYPTFYLSYKLSEGNTFKLFPTFGNNMHFFNKTHFLHLYFPYFRTVQSFSLFHYCPLYEILPKTPPGHKTLPEEIFENI